MAEDDNFLNDARVRLATTEPRRRRQGSIAARVEALKPEIQAARAAGKGWSRIAADIADGEPLNADAVRVAFMRCQKEATSSKSDSSKASSNNSRSASERKPVETATKPSNPIDSTDAFTDMFGPMFDARDTLGRSRTDDADREAKP